MSVISAIEIGYGTLTYPINEKGKRVFKTFPSTVSPATSGDLSGGLSKRDTVNVVVDGKTYEVGPEAELVTDRTSSRSLNLHYIDTDQYKALFLGALANMNEPNIDLLVLSLPVNNMSRRNDLVKFAQGTHKAGTKTVTIKTVWVLCQPLAGFMAYADNIGQERYSELSNHNCLVIDCGYLTVDWLVTKGLKINDRKSGAKNLGMSVILDNCEEVLRNSIGLKGLDEIPVSQIDKAFYQNKGVLQLGSQELPFPKCLGKDVNEEPVKIEYDCTDTIHKTTHAAIQAVRHSVGAGADIRTIIVLGGSHQAYLPAIKEAYPNHTITVVDEPLIAVCKGMVAGGYQYFEAMNLKEA